METFWRIELLGRKFSKFKRGRVDFAWLYPFGHNSVIFAPFELSFGYVGTYWLLNRLLWLKILQGVRNVLLASLVDMEETKHFQISWRVENWQAVSF